MLVPASGFTRPAVEAEADKALAERDPSAAAGQSLCSEGHTFSATLSQTLQWNLLRVRF